MQIPSLRIREKLWNTYVFIHTPKFPLCPQIEYPMHNAPPICPKYREEEEGSVTQLLDIAITIQRKGDEFVIVHFILISIDTPNKFS